MDGTMDPRPTETDLELEIGGERSDGAAGRRGEVSRRRFIRMGVLGTAMASVGLLDRDRQAAADLLGSSLRYAVPNGATGLAQAGPELALPPGFTYTTFGRYGSAMSDGFITPPIHDGMAAFAGEGGMIRIVRNHELGEGNDVPAGTVIGDPATAWDRRAPGGTTTLVFDPNSGELVEDFISLNGTDTNCAGVPTPWGTWLTCEETVAGVDSGRRMPHGYVFEVKASANAAKLTKPIKAMGRFLHEAGAVDPDTGVVYLTEDEGPDGFYRYVPDEPGKLRAGGVLQMLRVRGEDRYNTITGQTIGEVLTCDWVTIDDPNPRNAEDDASAVFKQGRRKGGAKFLGGEGCTYRDGSAVFGSSDGGDAGLGQVWQYTPTNNVGELNERGELVLLYESSGRRDLDGPDNMTTSPNGAIVICEDGNLTNNFVKALLPDGSLIHVAENLVGVQRHYLDASGKLWDPTVPDDGASAGDGIGYSEFAGATFSPDGQWLFVNIQVPGITCAITGDWASLGL
ncbi:MAG TPA: alkaline phosphatase PhoX [Actinomycetota bacterium]|nr:alkaline phosphatase PhoX [Actinomycetota bacterium]